jgi:cell division septation protein DedD
MTKAPATMILRAVFLASLFTLLGSPCPAYQMTPSADSAQSQDSGSTPLGIRKGAEYAVQVGAFAIPENARKLRDTFARNGYDATVLENFLDGANLLYLVWVGTYASMEEAESAREAIRQRHHIDGLVRMRTSWRR